MPAESELPLFIILLLALLSIPASHIIYGSVPKSNTKYEKELRVKDYIFCFDEDGKYNVSIEYYTIFKNTSRYCNPQVEFFYYSNGKYPLIPVVLSHKPRDKFMNRISGYEKGFCFEMGYTSNCPATASVYSNITCKMLPYTRFTQESRYLV